MKSHLPIHYITAGSIPRVRAFYGAGVGPIHLDDTRCVGNETKLIDCIYNTIHDCFHSNDSGVQCPYNGKCCIMFMMRAMYTES